MREFRRIGAATADLIALEDSAAEQSRQVERRFGEVLPEFIRKGKLLENESLTADTETAVAHGLGRAYSGFFPVRIIADTPVAWTGISGTDSASHIRIQTDTDCTMSIWVF